MGIIDLVKKDIVSLNQRVEDCLGHWNKEVSVPQTLFLIIVTALIISSNSIVTSYNGDLELISMAIKLAPQTIIDTFQTWGVVGTIVWYIPAFLIWVLGKLSKGKKKQMTASRIFYSYSILLSFTFFMSTVLSILSSPIVHIQGAAHLFLLLLSFLFLVIFAYLEIIILKVLLGPSISGIVIGWFGAGAIGFILIVVIIILGNLSQNNLEHTQNEVSFNVSVINQSEGSFTIDYNETTYSWNKVSGRYCVISFPKGWQTAPEDEYQKNYNRTYGGSFFPNRLFFNKSQWNSSSPEFVFINHIPPEEGGNRLFNWQESSYESVLNGISVTSDYGFIVTNATLSKNLEIGAETLDIYEVDENQMQIKHKVSIGFVDFVQMEFDYQSPYGKDSDFYYILDSIRCGNS